MCVAINGKGISQVASFLSLSEHSGHGRICCSLDPVAIDPLQKLARDFCLNPLNISQITLLPERPISTRDHDRTFARCH